MAVAKSYRNCKILCDPYMADGRKYVDVELASGAIRRVRYYTNNEYYRMYGEWYEPVVKVSERERLGFIDGYITIFKGSTYPHKEWMKEQGARYTRLFGWAFPSNVSYNEDELPEGLEPIQIPWEAVGADSDNLKPEEEVMQYVESLMYEPSSSEFQGVVGERLDLTLTVTKAITLENFYGTSIMHIMEDENGNVFVWITKAKNYPEGTEVTLRGTVKEHKTYKGVNQTILTRCKEI